MTLETIMQILYANNMTDVIVLATQIDNNITANQKNVGDTIIIQVSKEDLQNMGLKPVSENRGYWYNTVVTILGINKYALKDRYLVKIGNQTKWVNEEDGKPDMVTSIQTVAV